MPLGPGGLDANGIWLYGEDDSEALASDLLNLGMQSVSDALGAGIGKILQVVQTVKNDVFSTTSTSFVDVTGFSVSITPSSTSSKILVLANVKTSVPANSNFSNFSLVRNTTPIFTGATAGSRDVNSQSSVLTTGQYEIISTNANFLDSPATTSAIAYKIRMRSPDGGTAYLNRSSNDSDAAIVARTASSIIVMEVAG